MIASMEKRVVRRQRQRRIALTILVFLLCAVGEIHPQILPFEHYTTKNGLPSNWVTSIFQDSRGYLWIGGDGGMSVYDGIRFKTYGVDDGLPVAMVWAFGESRREPGTIWIGTHGGGLAKLQHGRISTIRLGRQFKQNVITSILEDDKGVVWCATAGGIFRLRGDSVSYFATGNDSLWASFITQTRDSLICIGLGKSLLKYSPRTGQMKRLGLRGNPSEILCMVEDDQGTIWLGTQDGTVYQIRSDRVVASLKLPFGELRRVLDDRQGALWFTTEHGIIKVSKQRFREGEFVRYSVENGLAENGVGPCLIDRENNLWFGGRSRGLCKLSDRNIYSFPLPEASNHHAAVDARGHLYVISETKLWEIWRNRRGQWQKHVHRLAKKDLPGKPFRLAVAPDTVLWVSFWEGGLNGYKIVQHEHGASDLKLVKKLASGTDLPVARASRFIVDRRNRLWYGMGDAKGVVQFDLNDMKRRNYFTEKNGFPPSTAIVLSDAPDGTFWIGTFANGVAIFGTEGGHTVPQRILTTKDGLAGDRIRSILHRKNGEVWIGTRFSGISVYKGGTFETITTKNGLLNNAVWALAEDRDGRVWVGTSVGVQHTAAAESRQFFTHERLVGKQTGTIGFIPKEDVVWALTSEDLTLYEYGRKSPVAAAPPVYITGLRVNGKAYPVKNGMEFSSNENLCVVLFSGISFTEKRALRYRYRLLGLDDHWQEPTDQRAVTYASLRPGSYTFEVKALNAGGVESATPAILSFTILAPIWQRSWFIAVSVALGLGLVYSLHRYRLRRVLEIERIRSRIATDLHDDIGAGLTHIGLLSEVALRKSRMRQNGREDAPSQSTEQTPPIPDEAVAELGNSMKRVGAIARELSANMSDVVWSINPKHDSVVALQHRLTAFAQEICSAKNIDLHFDVSERIAKIKLHPEVRRNLLLIAKEALHNMAKYSGSSTVTVKIDADGQQIFVRVEDCGKGFDLNGAGNGNGLTNMRQRAEKMGGRCEIVSERGKGTRVTAVLPYQV